MFVDTVDGDINMYADSVVGYIRKWIDDTVPQSQHLDVPQPETLD